MLGRWWKARRQISAENAERLEKAEIARLFNDRYTYRVQWVPDSPRLPGSAMGGINPRGGYAWMCPECNRIHFPEECSVFSGLQYPACCHTGAGHRLDENIKIN